MMTPKSTFSVRRRSLIKAALGTGAGAIMGVPAIARANKKISIRVGHALSTQEPVHAALLRFGDRLQERSDGRVSVTVYPADQLGRQKELSEMVRMGANILQFTDASFLGEWVPEASVLQAPYLLEDSNNFARIMQSDWYADLGQKLGARNVKLLTFNIYGGVRNTIGDRPVRSPADLNGLNFRCANSLLYIEYIKSIGARPITTAWSEAYTAISQNLASFAEASLSNIYTSKLHEVCKYLSLTEHMVQWAPLITGESYFATLPSDIQALIIEEAQELGRHTTTELRSLESELVSKFESAGLTIVRDIDKQAFMEATTSMYQQYPGWPAGIRDTIRKAAGE